MIHLACYADGRPAPLHLLAGVPPERVVSRNSAGAGTGVKPNLDGGVSREEPLSMARGCKPPPLPFLRPGRLMRKLGSVI